MGVLLNSAIGTALMAAAIKAYAKKTCGFCHSARNLEGKVAIITGANSGMGFETAKDLARRGASVILACRNPHLGSRACDAIINEYPPAKVDTLVVDVSSMESVRSFCKQFKAQGTPLDIFIANAGVAATKKALTPEGLEIDLATNHLGHFLMTILLLEKMANPGGRIVLISSVYHRFIFGEIDVEDLNSTKGDATIAYVKTKLYTLLFTKELHRRLQGSPLKDRVFVNALHPGMVDTDIFRHARNDHLSWQLGLLLTDPFYKTPWEGAQTAINCAVGEDLEGISGQYWSDCKITIPSKKATDPELGKALWDKSVELVKLTPEEDYFAQNKI